LAMVSVDNAHGISGRSITFSPSATDGSPRQRPPPGDIRSVRPRPGCGGPGIPRIRPTRFEQPAGASRPRTR
jgi:hypothetical protein